MTTQEQNLPSATIGVGEKKDLTFIARDSKTGEIVTTAIITNQKVVLTNPSISSFIQDSVNPNIFHFTGLQAGTTNINCSAIVLV